VTSNEERLPRLLAMVPYFLAHQGITAAEAAGDFGISEKQLRRDLDLLWMCGLPGHGPGDLIDLSYEGDTVTVVFDAGMSRPLRLTNEEALALVVALRTLAETPGIADSDAVQRALAKVERAAGGAVDDTTVAIELDSDSRMLPALRQALDTGHALLMRYYTATRDETTERVVDPMRIFEMDGHNYLEAWCRSAEGMRVFRLDRIEHLEQLDEPSAAYFWVADYYSTEDVAEIDGLLQVSLRVADPAWVRALALGSAGQVEVLSPDWLAEAIRSDAATALAAYAAK
jgi:proteasome accessory factor C